MKKKDRLKLKLIEYLSDPENDFLPRFQYAVTIMGYKKPQSLYRLFTPAELFDIEAEALVERKQRSSGQRAIVYDALYRAAKDGSVPAIREFLDRTEGKVADKLIHDGTTRITGFNIVGVAPGGDSDD